MDVDREVRKWRGHKSPLGPFLPPLIIFAFFPRSVAGPFSLSAIPSPPVFASLTSGSLGRTIVNLKRVESSSLPYPHAPGSFLLIGGLISAVSLRRRVSS